jgi:hypothetical protein
VNAGRSSEKDQPVTSKTAAFITDTDLLDDPSAVKPKLTRSEHHHQLLEGVAALEMADMTQARSVVLPPIRAGPAKPPICYSIPEAARAAAIGTTKLRLEIAAGRLRCRKIGKRSVITSIDLEIWAAALPDIRDVAPDKAATALKGFRKSALTET